MLFRSETPPQKTNSILFVGNIKKHKGLKTLLDAFEKACGKGLKSKLVIVGNKDNFRTGEEHYESSLTLVQPSLYEGFGIPPLEAMVCGTPAIISDIPVFKEIYSGFPVVFFKTGNSQELCEKLLEIEKNPAKIELGELKEKYSYKRSATLITQKITSVIKTN